MQILMSTILILERSAAEVANIFKAKYDFRLCIEKFNWLDKYSTSCKIVLHEDSEL